ncbi:TonB-dependent receptor [Rhodoferax sp.]|uniref:TonB-dependent receptor n=1 Tax=Rhodoferax sp. TaxID=50421 RepID=UPI00271D93D7|nr:TonB-dependent receptor [Rhodoferax sp.]MDO9197244.1 TonB-dependent receptor [Rhodoferax sp.]
MKKFSLALVSLGSLSGATVFAQTPPEATLAPVTITGNPLGATDLIAPAAQYSGADLLFRAKSTLGETLDGTPGISSTYFGPNASRPIIRGLDGDRIRILNNGGATADASSLSYDHAVTADPLSIERIEVLRGPGALQYGGSAVGGVVNVIDNRIPREALFDAKGGVTGKVDLGLASGNAEQGGGLLLEGGNDRYALHADVFNRTTGDVSVPLALACSKPGAPTLANKICNSASDTRGGAVGGSVFFSQGYVGASVSKFLSDYGTVAEDEVTIGMKSDRYALEGELRGLGGLFQSVKGQLGRSVYEHTEYEGATAGTVFKNSGNDLRLEARHARLGPLDGVVGLQADTSRFSADGEEAFAPYSQTRQTALFAYEELGTGWGRLSAGARIESVTVESFGNPLMARFAPGSRSFAPASYALGALWNIAPGWQLSSNLAYTQRAPKDYELFADGPHLATHSYEVGNASLVPEQSTNLDLGVNWKHGAHRFGVSAFVNQFNNYIAQEATGAIRDALPEYAYTQVQARFRGLEASGSARLLDGAQTVDLELRGDLVRAVNTSTSQPLPRIAPARVGATLLWAQGPWNARLGASHVAAQTDVPIGQLGTGAYTLWNAWFGYRVKAGAANLLWFARIDNLSDVLAYSATSILTQTAAGKAPLPGLSLKVGLQASF